jgi:hypothetical protein
VTKKPKNQAYFGPVLLATQATQRQHRADFDEDSGSDEHENHGYDIERPRGVKCYLIKLLQRVAVTAPFSFH